MKQLITILFLGLSINLSGQKEYQEKTLTTKTEQVTVFLKGAQVFRMGSINLQKGNYDLVMKSLSPNMDPNSINVKAAGDLKIISVQHQYDYLEENTNSKKVDSLQNLIDKVEDDIRIKSNRSNVLNQKEALIAANKNLGSENISSTQLLQMLSLYEKELTSIKEEQSTVNIELSDLRNRLSRLNNQLSGIARLGKETKSNILVKVEVLKTTNANFEVSYFVEGAGWYPKYRLNVKDITQPIALEYQAEVFQQTGEDWNNVKLRFSNAEPNQNKDVPELETWYLDYARFTQFKENDISNLGVNRNSVKGSVVDAETGEPLPGVNVIVQGTSIGTTTDLQGNYSVTVPRGSNQLVFSYIGMKNKTVGINSSIINVGLETDVQELSEVVVTAYGYASRGERLSKSKRVQGKVAGVNINSAEKMTSTVVKKQTNIEFEVEDAYTIKSGSPQMFIDLKEYEVKADYHYVSIPKLDKNAYLVAAIANWDQYNLMEGEAKLFFEGAFVGTTILNANATIDTLQLSLGNDKGIVIERDKIDDFSTRNFIGLNQSKKVGFEIKLRNTKSQPIKLNLYDQIPVSLREQIEVNLEEKSKAKYIEKTGELKWELNLNSNESVSKKFIYEVKYPKGEKVILE